MKAIIAAIAAIGAMSSLVGSANADVSISINFSSSPSYRSSSSYYPENYRTYHRRYNNNSNVIVREVYPSTVYSSKSSQRRYNSSQGDRYGDDRYGDRYIIEKRIVRVR